MMGILQRLHSIFTKNTDSEVSHLSGAIDDSISKVVDVMTDMEIQSVITSSTGEWLDSWGSRFGIIRETGEQDDPYRERILASVTNKKGTLEALRQAVYRALGEDALIRIEETHKDIRIFNVSTFSGTGKFMDSDTTRLGVVKITIDQPETEKLREEIWKSRASGTRVIIEVLKEGFDESQELYDFRYLDDQSMLEDEGSPSQVFSKLTGATTYNLYDLEQE